MQFSLGTRFLIGASLSLDPFFKFIFVNNFQGLCVVRGFPEKKTFRSNVLRQSFVTKPIRKQKKNGLKSSLFLFNFYI